MLRLLFWFGIWCLSLGFASIDARYNDGVKIRFYSHAERKKRRRK